MNRINHDIGWPIIIICWVSILCVFSCDQNNGKQKYKIGFSQCVSNDAWRRAMQAEMYRELSFYPEIDFFIKDAQGSSERQIQQVREMISEGIDLLIISPNESGPLTPIVEEAYQSGLPVIVIDRKINSNQYSAYIGGNNFEIGFTAGQYVHNLLNGKGKVLEIWGLKGSSPAKERHRGFLDAIEGSGISIVAEIEGEWEKDTARSRLNYNLASGLLPEFDLVFGHNDVMGIGAYEICRDWNISGKNFIGVDALPGPYGGIQAISDGILDASFFYPTGGDIAILIARNILNGNAFQKENLLQTSVVDASNVRIMKQQTDKILTQQENIFRQKELIENQLELYQSQQGLLIVFGITLFVAIASLAYVFKSLKDKQEINRELKDKNLEILDQQKKILKYSKKAADATRHKLEFFTNISHEFRTPLTLIQGPVEELLYKKEAQSFKSDILLIQRNTHRLLGLVNQLMDFRKIDHKKMKIKASLLSISLFIEEIMFSFKKMAEDHQVHFRLITENRNLKVWFDPSMMDKVMFNLLSNAFKFIPQKGHLHIFIDEDHIAHEAIIRVEDNGPGMNPEESKNAFDRFYQGKPGERKTGTGLGLALSKELVELHQGTIKIVSLPGGDTAFEVRLKLGNTHFNPSELEASTEIQEYLHEQIDVYCQRNQEQSLSGQSLEQKLQKILIVEDDVEIRSYLKRKLEDQYEVIEADDPDTAWRLIMDKVPDLVTCDIMLKNKDGLILVKKIKANPITATLPIIIISAKNSQEDRLVGIKLGIDDYFSKPFSISLILERIKAVLDERIKLKEHYLHELPLEIQNIKHEDKKFTVQFKAVVEKNISNPDFGVAQICKELGLSKGQLYRKLKVNLGYGVNDYINKIRLKKAKFLLLNQDESIGEIAFHVGYKTAPYFSTAFKNAYGLTPSAFREHPNPDKF